MPRTKSSNSIDKHVGSRIRMRRRMLDMNQTKLGDALEITLSQVHKYEKGINRIGASTLQHISQIHRVPVAFFFERIEKARERAYRNENTTSDYDVLNLTGLDKMTNLPLGNPYAGGELLGRF